MIPNALYIVRMNEFLAHWSECNAVLPPGAPLLIRLPDSDTLVSRGQLEARRNSLQTQLGVVQSCLGRQQIVRASIRRQKTTLLEQFTDNPFLPFFYESPERYGFPVELFFMTERHKQLQGHFGQPDLFQQTTVADYFFVKTLLFAKNNLNGDFDTTSLISRRLGLEDAPKTYKAEYCARPVDTA